ncbi:MAG: HNH endonuclease [Verrucomicrobiota bacterium]|jgi:hypothetical protein
MSIQDSTIKRLFGMSSNRCAIPECKSPLIIGEVVVGEICHIRARRKGGARHDPELTAEEKDQFDNLILLCSTCHKLIDSCPGEYTSEWLRSIKASHERKAPQPLDLSMADARHALMILAKHTAKTRKVKMTTGDVTIAGGVHSTAAHGAVSVAIGGANQGEIHIKVPAPKPSRMPYPANSIGADANMTNYVEYLCDLYVKYMRPIEPNEDASWAKIGRHIKSKFHLKKKTRNHLSAERFADLVNFLIGEKLARTPVGAKHLRQGTKMCRTFEEFRHGTM